MIERRYTRHQVARGSRPDAVVNRTAYLIKNVSTLRLTYQIRLLTFAASESGSRLVIRIPRRGALSRDLDRFVQEHKKVVDSRAGRLMGLYLRVFEGDGADREVEGVEVGGYDDFETVRRVIADRLEGGQRGSRFPVLMSHQDSDGTWSPSEARALRAELETIEGELAEQPAFALAGTWQAKVARTLGLKPRNLAECFFDADGEPLLQRSIDLADACTRTGQPIWFQ